MTKYGVNMRCASEEGGHILCFLYKDHGPGKAFRPPQVLLSQAAKQERELAWPLGLRNRLLDAPTHSMLAQQGPVHAVALAQTPDGCLAYCTGHTGALKIFNATNGAQVRPTLMWPSKCRWR